ncbi:MAG: cysteine desulfurase [Selenomonas ruminantium]|nr:cysteine desulfurase [Selenomonas ruminantium]
MIYADHAATTKLLPEAFDAMFPFLNDEYGNPSQPYRLGVHAKKALAQARENIASCIGAEPEEIYFTSGGSESDNWAIKSVLFQSSEQKRIVTSTIEHHAVLNSCSMMQHLGVPITYLPVDSQGLVHLDHMADAIHEHTSLVSIMLANNEIGTIEPIKELAALTHDKKALFHTDAVQAVGHIPINVKELDVDMLSASAHKFRGPKGVGFLYIRKGITLPPYISGGVQERGKRAGTENVAAIVGMSAALVHSVKHMRGHSECLRQIEQSFISALTEHQVDFKRNGAKNHLPGCVNVSFRDSDGEMLMHRLDLKGICISTGSACDSVDTAISHVLQAIKVPAEYAEGTIRVTFGDENSIEDAVAVANELSKILCSNDG